MTMTHRPAGEVCNCGRRGWMPGVIHVPIRWQRPAYMLRDEGKMEPYVVVDHIAQGFIRTITAWASNGESKIITHFGIERDGAITQYQGIYTEGIHVSTVSNPTAQIVKQYGSIAGRGANAYSIGIEHEGFSVPPGYSYDYTYSQSRPWPVEMVESSIAVKRWVFEQPDTNLGDPSRDSIIGHYEVDQRNRINDPVSQEDRSVWPVSRMIAALHSAHNHDRAKAKLTSASTILAHAKAQSNTAHKALLDSLDEVKERSIQEHKRELDSIRDAELEIAEAKKEM